LSPTPYRNWCPNYFNLITGLVSHPPFTTHHSTALSGIEVCKCHKHTHLQCPHSHCHIWFRFTHRL
jgi:hypothetical protein